MRTRLMTKQDNKCPNCGEALEESASACPHCGHPASPLGSGHSEGDAFLTLMTANVLRLRRQWAEAETKCGEVLHRHPGNGAAHSLMGDITAIRGSCGRPSSGTRWRWSGTRAAPPTAGSWRP